MSSVQSPALASYLGLTGKIDIPQNDIRDSISARPGIQVVLHAPQALSSYLPPWHCVARVSNRSPSSAALCGENSNDVCVCSIAEVFLADRIPQLAKSLRVYICGSDRKSAGRGTMMIRVFELDAAGSRITPPALQKCGQPYKTMEGPERPRAQRTVPPCPGP